MPGATPDWLNILDLPRAVYNCRQDMVGDWYRDPWGWAEVEFVRKYHEQMVIRRLNDIGVRRSAILEVAKENFSTRPAIVMEPVDRLIYQALVDRTSKQCIGALRPWSHGWRLHTSNPQSGVYARNDDEWKSIADD